MKASLWRLAAACFVLSAPYALADGCRTMEDEVAEAASASFVPIAEYRDVEARAFMAVVNKLAPQPIDADQVRVFANPEASQVMLTFFKQGCFVLRAAVPVLLFRQIHNDTLRSLADEKAS